MPKSRTRKKNNKFQFPGSNRHLGSDLKLEEIIKVQSSYRNKYVEYVAKDLEELNEIRDQGTIKGTYLIVLNNVIEEKEIEKQKIIEQTSKLEKL